MKIKLIVILVFTLFINTTLFAETEEEKYRVNNIHPVQAGSGITTGHVIAYGHYIKPPYKVTMEEKDIIVNYDKDMNPVREKQYYVYINGVQVAPTLTLQELKTGKVIQGMEGIDVNRERIKRISGPTIESLAIKYYELVKKSGKANAIQEIEKDLRNDKNVKSYNIDLDKETIKTDFGDGEFKCSFDDFARMGLIDKIHDFVFYLNDNFGKWENEYGIEKAEEMLYEKIKENPLIESYEPFDRSTRWIKVKFKEKQRIEEFSLQYFRTWNVIPATGEKKKKMWESRVEGFKKSLSADSVEMIIPGNSSAVPVGIFQNGLKVLRRTDIDNSTKIKMLGDALHLSNKEVLKYVIYNFNPAEYADFGDKK